METMNMRMPPAMKNEPGWMPRKRRMALPVKMKTHSTTKATIAALRIVARLRRAEKLPGEGDEDRHDAEGIDHDEHGEEYRDDLAGERHAGPT